MSDNTKVLAALLAGVAAGVAIGILFAPDKGSETRDKLTDSLKNLGNSIKDRAADEINNLSNFKEKVVDGIKSTIKTAEKEYSKTRHDFDSALDKTEGDLNSIIKS
jgi:gas vesicle protein